MTRTPIPQGIGSGSKKRVGFGRSRRARQKSEALRNLRRVQLAHELGRSASFRIHFRRGARKEGVMMLLALMHLAAAHPSTTFSSSAPLLATVKPLLPSQHRWEMTPAVERLMALRGGETSVGPIRLGPILINFRIGPHLCVYLNAAAGLLYSMSLIGLDPNLPDPTLKYWQQEQTTTTKAILQYFALALVWINAFMVYAMLQLNAPATGLLRFQSFGWLSTLGLLCFQVNHYGFHAQQDTLGIMLTLLGLSSYLGFAR